MVIKLSTDLKIKINHGIYLSTNLILNDKIKKKN
jgi:hypothetical protein